MSSVISPLIYTLLADRNQAHYLGMRISAHAVTLTYALPGSRVEVIEHMRRSRLRSDM